ncbi:DUF6471 domain-containing protein [Phenylobacterium montanum]|uniref:DUF6471 domain-containing protein n=1 Tax=Phenylobacterium montanum TaxID=2823693 RepID=UPI0034602773
MAPSRRRLPCAISPTKALVEELHAVGVEETNANLGNRISRGGFLAGFFIQCLVAIGAHSVRVHEPE